LDLEPRGQKQKGELMTRKSSSRLKAPKPPAVYSQRQGRRTGVHFGTPPVDPATGFLPELRFRTNTNAKNIASILAEAGSSLEKIVSVTVVLADWTISPA